MRKMKFCNFRPFFMMAILMIISICLAVFVVETQNLRLIVFISLFIPKEILLATTLFLSIKGCLAFEKFINVFPSLRSGIYILFTF